MHNQSEAQLSLQDFPRVTNGRANGQESVSVVIPCYNEANFIGKVLENLADQYESDRYEIIVVDGRSEDRTRDKIQAFKLSRPELSIVLVDNPARKIPIALNLGIAAAHGEIIARMDAHAVPSDGYVRRCVEVLSQEAVGVVGMPCHVLPASDTLLAHAIAGAVLGGYNESLSTNEDYDFNFRVRLAGRDVILDRSGHCDYFARSTLQGLATQYRRYGGWKARMIRLHPRSMKPRHSVAPVFVLSLVSLTVLSFFSSLALLLLSFEVCLYLLLALVCGWQIMQRSKAGPGMLLIMPLIFLTIHLTWGFSFLLGLVRQPR